MTVVGGCDHPAGRRDTLPVVRRVLTPGWLVLHVLAVLAVAVMLWLAGWQLVRGMDGNSISWGYALQWPVFAGFAVFVWIREVRRTVRPEATDVDTSPNAPSPESADAPYTGQPQFRRPVITRRVPAHTAPAVEEDDPEVAAYNRYLAWLNANPGARPGDFPG